MCGIVGVVTSEVTELKKIGAATNQLSRRGPDNQSTVLYSGLALGHSRLSIIDTSEVANQPFKDNSGRYVIIYNGEIYNFLELRKILVGEGVDFRTDSDTEVLINLYIKYGKDCLEKLNGFFSFSIYDKEEDSLFIARDRFGIKPLLYYHDEEKFIFASELKAIFSFSIQKKIDKVSLFNYLQFNYVPSNNSILERVKKLSPGSYMFFKNITKGIKEVKEVSYYQIENREYEEIVETNLSNYESAKKKLEELLNDSVRTRLVADVPVGAFLSGGVDSSVVSILVKKHKPDLQTFSIGYKENKFYDETEYANSVAKKIGSRHHVFSLSNNDLYEHLDEILDYIDEPFADSSAIAVYILSKYTRKHITVALSGDGADEMFSGYNKHEAEFKSRYPGISELLVNAGHLLWKNLPKSRRSKWSNINRQLFKFSSGSRLSNKFRYWEWAKILNEEEANYLLKEELVFNRQRLSDHAFEYKKRKEELLKSIRKEGSINDVLRTDMKVVLTNDMLKKVDSMSMANSLEVRTPFLDHRLVDFVFSLPPSFKINVSMRKKILQDTFRDSLPIEVFGRPKQGFEVPLLDWFKGELRSKIENELLEDSFIERQGIFNVAAIRNLKKMLFSVDPGDAPATVWALIVFNVWWKKYIQD